jgi:hypothetical protein
LNAVTDLKIISVMTEYCIYPSSVMKIGSIFPIMLNTQNLKFGVLIEILHDFVETSLQLQKISVLLAVSRRRIHRPVFFQGSVIGKRYREEFFEPFIHHLDDKELSLGYFQQDGATTHITGVALAYLQFCGNRVISLELNPQFPPYSPDLTPLDFSIFGYLKDQVPIQIGI